MHWVASTHQHPVGISVGWVEWWATGMVVVGWVVVIASGCKHSSASSGQETSLQAGAQPFAALDVDGSVEPNAF